MSDYNEGKQNERVPEQAPWQAPDAPLPVRHRRSDRHKAGGAAGTNAPTEAPAPYPFEERDKPAPAPEFTRRVVALNEPDEYDGDEDTQGRTPWLKIGLIALLALIGLCAVLYFIPSAGPLEPVKKGVEDAVRAVFSLEKKEAAEALSFQSLSSTGMAGGKIEFQATTNKAVEDVRLETENGTPVNAEVSLVNGEGETNKIWKISASFNDSYDGSVALALKAGQEWQASGKALPLKILEPTPVPAEEPTPEPLSAPTAAPDAANVSAPAATQEPRGADEEEPAAQPADDEEQGDAKDGETAAGDANALPVIPTWAPAKAEAATDAPDAETPAPTEAPTPAPTEAPTPAPTSTPEPTATPVPTPPPATAVPRLAADENLGVAVNDTVFIGGKAQKDYARERGYVAPNPDAYAYYDAGVFTFRGDNFRRNAAFGTAEITDETMQVIWQSEIGSLRTADSGTLYGVGWTGQPAIIKWTKEAREMMNLTEEKKNTAMLREVIFGAQDGKIYFLDLTDGSATREPIQVGYSLKGSVSVDTYGRPMLAIGQGISKLANGKTGTIGLHVYNLITGEKAFMINGRKSNSQLQYCSNGAFDGTALFLYQDDAMIVAGENGLLYTVDLGSKFTYPRAEEPDVKGSLSLNESITYLRSKGAGETDVQVGVESSVAMYDKYVYLADTYGLMRCVDTDSMKTVWSFDTGDNVDAAIALDMEDGERVSLYTGNTAFNRLGSKKDVTIRKMDALTGNELWNYTIKCDVDKKAQASGCKASPVIGQHSISGLVIFTVNMVEGGGSRMIALQKEDGAVAWSFEMSENAVSSPVAVYNEAGDAWIIQADQGGTLHLISALNGREKSTLNLGGEIQASPAVYRNYLVIGTCSKNNSYMYGIQLQ